MKILKIIHGYPPTYNAGSEVYSQTLCNELSKNHKVFVFTREENPYLPDFYLRKEELETNLEIYFINLPREKDGFRHSKLDQVFSEVLRETQPDIAHIGHLNHLSTGIVDVLFTLKVPIVYTLHDFWLMCPRGQFLQTNFGEEEYYRVCDGQENRKCAISCYNSYFTGYLETREKEISYWTNWIEIRMKEAKSICEKVDLFISPSKYLKSRFVNEFSIPDEKIFLLDYGFDLNRFRGVQNKKEAFTFGYIGTHIPAKGVNLLIDAFQDIKANAHLKIWGRNNGPSTIALQKKASRVNNIEFMGEYHNQNISEEVFAKIDCLVVPSIWMENSPLVIHEAQAAKIPIITADVGGMKEFVNHKKNGLLFEHRNRESLTKQMKFAVNNPSAMKTMGEKGYLYSETGQIPSIEDHGKQILELYNNLLNTK